MSHDSNFHLYLHLFHGRRSLDEDWSDWGVDGPWIGPLTSVQTTYAHTIKLTFVHPQDAVQFDLDPVQPWLTVHDMMLQHGGVYYGEWTVCAKSDMVDTNDTFDTCPPDDDFDTLLMSAYEGRFELDEVMTQ